MKHSLLQAVALLSLVACGAKPHYLTDNKGAGPSLLQSIASKNFYTLPLSGEIADHNKFWSGDYWAHRKGNINLRWNSLDPIGFDLLSPSKEELVTWTPSDMATLSPSEKYDLFTGQYDYPLREDVSTHASPGAREWEGICDGWAPASMNHKEPRPKVRMNPDGIPIPFGSADIKALISYYYAFEYVANTYQEGRRCPRTGGWFNWNRDCREDLSPATFHLILANRIGIQRTGFIADVERYKEVWNHPIVSYQSFVVSDDAPQDNSVPGTARTVRVHTKMFYTDESDFNTWEPIIGTEYQITSSREYEYLLDLDAVGNIIGGDWKSSERPDFVWSKEAPKVFTGILARLGELLDD